MEVIKIIKEMNYSHPLHPIEHLSETNKVICVSCLIIIVKNNYNVIKGFDNTIKNKPFVVKELVYKPHRDHTQRLIKCSFDKKEIKTMHVVIDLG